MWQVEFDYIRNTEIIKFKLLTIQLIVKRICLVDYLVSISNNESLKQF